ncbi:MAG: Hydrolase, TatD family [Candidatus Daviesbacteria bacterium GW2011_GWB1_36_5]|uniref:Hydrolase, TatD family n=3 Tax=Candidatus Daviesiibacteriota TaxID=1752718 RepID=A0A0G0HEC1_9BACT|nr:MAG: Hydrolase, TatD family [Candidatus Daviesbacteria bacterium GW2011_GWB1_36_5]
MIIVQYVPMLFDTHSHIQFKSFDKNRKNVIERAKKAGVKKIIAIGTDLESSKKAAEISIEYPEVFASVGIHPHHVFSYLSRHSEFISESYKEILKQVQDDGVGVQDDIRHLEDLFSNPKVVAVGETGMDKYQYKITKYSNYSVSKQFIKLQKEIFKMQIKLAIMYKKALIIHNREAVEETLEVLKESWDKKLEGRTVFHYCEPDKRVLDFAKSHKIYIGVDGDVLTDKIKQEFVKIIPLDLLVLETDSPFLNSEPAKIKTILEFISKLLKIQPKGFEKILFNNSSYLFNNYLLK